MSDLPPADGVFQRWNDRRKAEKNARQQNAPYLRQTTLELTNERYTERIGAIERELEAIGNATDKKNIDRRAALEKEKITLQASIEKNKLEIEKITAKPGDGTDSAVTDQSAAARHTLPAFLI